MTTFKLIKATPFDTNGTKGITYTVALKGRVLNVSTLSFADEAVDTIKADDKAGTLTINCAIEVVKKPYVSLATGEVMQGLSVLPAFGVAISDI